MSVLAMALVNDIEWNSSGTSFNAQVEAVGINTSQINFTIIVTNVPATILTSALQGAVSSAVKAKLASDYGITAGLFDTVGVIGADLGFI
jgi:hypothetical protein